AQGRRAPYAVARRVDRLPAPDGTSAAQNRRLRARAPQLVIERTEKMKILVINVNTSASMTETIGESARHYASPGTEVIALQPHFGAEAVDCNFESYLSAVGIMDRIVTYDGPFDAVVMAGFGEHGRDGLQELIEPPV